MTEIFETEQDITDVIVPWLGKEGWDVYEQISAQAGSATADVVALKGEKSHVVEVKKAPSLRLLYQAINWQNNANLVSIAVPEKFRKDHRDLKCLCRLLGLGLIVVTPKTACYSLEPVRRNVLYNVGEVCHREHFRKLSKFDSDVNDMAEYMLKNPEITADDAHDHVRDQSWSGKELHIQTFIGRVKKGDWPGLYLRQGVVMSESQEVSG